MRTFPSGTRTVFARTISAEIRSRIGASRMLTGQKLALGIGRSQNYVAERLRDEKPFTVDDIEAISEYFGEDPVTFANDAFTRWFAQVEEELERAEFAASAVREDPRDGVSELAERQARRAPAPVKRAARTPRKSQD